MNEINKKIENSRVEKAAEQKEKLPEMKFKFIFLRHKTEKDAELIENDLKECDVFCPESLCWREDAGYAGASKYLMSEDDKIAKSTLESIRKIPDANDFLMKIFEFIYKYKKPLFMVDIPYDESYLKLGEERGKKYNAVIKKFLSGNLEGATDESNKFYRIAAEMQLMRELTIVENFKNLRGKIIEKYPELVNKKEIKVFSCFGTIHTGIYHRLKKEGIASERQFSDDQIVYTYTDELIRKKMFFPQKEISSEETFKMVIDSILFRYLVSLNNNQYLDYIDYAKIERWFLEKINFNDIQKSGLFDELKKEFINKGEAFVDLEASSFALFHLNKKLHLNLPENKEELNKIIKNLR